MVNDCVTATSQTGAYHCTSLSGSLTASQTDCADCVGLTFYLLRPAFSSHVSIDVKELKPALYSVPYTLYTVLKHLKKITERVHYVHHEGKAHASGLRADAHFALVCVFREHK